MTEHKAHEATDKPELEDWPAEGLESVAACPVCASQHRRVLYTGLRDRIFFCAPGEWTLHECTGCGSAYLDPRPTPETIHLAYQTYYTHQETKRLPMQKLHGLSRVQRLMANGYRNWRFGTAFEPASVLGVLVAFLLPGKRAMLDREFRHLPPAPHGGRLLDVGFGDGGFLENARAAGWDVVGVDPDPAVVANARQRGLNVYQGSLETLDGQDGRFDVITMSHVIEHVHDPRATLQQAYRLLKPGGMLWLETPNIASLGNARFGRHWRGLEPPRHLVIFNWKSLAAMLDMVGFEAVRPHSQFHLYSSQAAASEAIETGVDPYAEHRIALRHRIGGVIVGLVLRVRPHKSEFITLTASKPTREPLDQ